MQVQLSLHGALPAEKPQTLTSAFQAQPDRVGLLAATQLKPRGSSCGWEGRQDSLNHLLSARCAEHYGAQEKLVWYRAWRGGQNLAYVEETNPRCQPRP